VRTTRRSCPRDTVPTLVPMSDKVGVYFTRGTTMRNRRRGCLIALGLIMLLLVGGVLWVARPSGLELPPRQYPPNNAYPKLVAIAQRASQKRKASPSIERLVQKLGDSSTEATLTPADHQTLQQAFEPLLREYRPYLTQPSVVVLEYTPIHIARESADFRTLARVEAYFARRAFISRRPAEGVERATALMQLGWQISHEGSISHFLTAAARRFHARTALVEHLATLQDTIALQRLLDWARAEEERRPELAKIIQTEYFLGLAVFQMAFSVYEVSWDDSVSPWWWRYPVVRQWYARVALPEYRRGMQQLTQTAQKPAWERTPVDFPQFTQAFNTAFFDVDVFRVAMRLETYEVAYSRMLGCVAAIRLHKQRTGRYPDSLESLRLGDLAIDPFTGAPFVYKVDPQRGFMLYSAGENRVDDGGVQRDGWGAQGDLIILPDWGVQGGVVLLPQFDAPKPEVRAQWLR